MLASRSAHELLRLTVTIALGGLACSPHATTAATTSSAQPLGATGATSIAAPPATAADAEPSSPSPARHALRAPKGDPAYFLLDGSLVQLDADGFDTLPLAEPIYSLQTTDDGKVHAIAFDAVLTLVDGVLSPITARASEGIVAVHVVDEGDIWATRMAELVHWDGSQWRHEEVAAIDALQRDFSIELSPTGVMVDRDARVWLSTARDVMVKDPGGWHVLARNKLGGHPKRLWLDRAGAAVLQLETDAFVRLPDDPKAAPTRSEPPPHSTWLTQRGQTWSVVHADARGRTNARALGRDIDGVMAFGQATDARGRLWISTAAGVTIFAGASVIEWPTGTIEAFAGRVDEIAVVGRGPDTLPPAGPMRTGGVRARLVKDGRPVAGARVEICTHALGVTIPPCAESSPSFRATSDADGSFTIDRVPVGDWSLAVQTHGQWRLLHRGLEPFRIGAGSATDFGELDPTRGMVAVEDRKRKRKRGR